MQQLPHKYSVTAAAQASGDVALSAAGVPQMVSASPVQFGGPGDKWSPEDLLVAAVAGCFVLTFRAVARASKLPWTQLECGVEGTLERVAGLMQFSKFVTRAVLTVPGAVDTVLCERVLTQAEHGCLIANSLQGERSLQIEIVRSDAPPVRSGELLLDMR